MFCWSSNVCLQSLGLYFIEVSYVARLLLLVSRNSQIKSRPFTPRKSSLIILTGCYSDIGPKAVGALRPVESQGLHVMTERYYSVDPDQPPSPADLYIDHELHQAEAEDRNIDDTAAKLIAGFIHNGQASSYYSLASSGAVDYDGLSREIVIDYTDPRAPSWMRKWLDHLGSYAVEHAGRGMVPGWHELTRDENIARLLGEAGIAGS